MAFRGTFDHTLDAKSRLTVPARYRAALADGVVLAMPVDQQPCVGVWRPQDYERYTERALAGCPRSRRGWPSWSASSTAAPTTSSSTRRDGSWFRAFWPRTRA